MVEPDAIAVVELATNQTRRIPFERAQSVAAFDDQVWIAAG